MTESLVANVDANLFRCVHMVVSTEETRGYLCGVRIEKNPAGGVVMVATDGHRMMVARDEAGSCDKPVTIGLPRDALLACAPRKEDPAPRLSLHRDGIVEVGNRWRLMESCIVDGAYPDWRKCVPVRKWPNVPATFRGEYLGDFGKIARMLSGRKYAAMRVLTADATSSALILFPQDNELAFGLLMPMYGADCEGLPRWMIPVMAAPKKKRKTRR